MTINVPIQELDELLKFIAIDYLRKEHDSKLSQMLESIVESLRKGLLKFDTQTIKGPFFTLVLLSVESRSVTFSIDTRFESLINKLRAYRGFTVDDKPAQGCCLWQRVKHKFATDTYVCHYDLNAIESVKEYMDKLGLACKSAKITAESITIEMAVADN